MPVPARIPMRAASTRASAPRGRPDAPSSTLEPPSVRAPRPTSTHAGAQVYNAAPNSQDRDQKGGLHRSHSTSARRPRSPDNDDDRGRGRRREEDSRRAEYSMSPSRPLGADSGRYDQGRRPRQDEGRLDRRDARSPERGNYRQRPRSPSPTRYDDPSPAVKAGGGARPTAPNSYFSQQGASSQHRGSTPAQYKPQPDAQASARQANAPGPAMIPAPVAQQPAAAATASTGAAALKAAQQTFTPAAVIAAAQPGGGGVSNLFSKLPTAVATVAGLSYVTQHTDLAKGIIDWFKDSDDDDPPPEFKSLAKRTTTAKETLAQIQKTLEARPDALEGDEEGKKLKREVEDAVKSTDKALSKMTKMLDEMSKRSKDSKKDGKKSDKDGDDGDDGLWDDITGFFKSKVYKDEFEDKVKEADQELSKELANLNTLMANVYSRALRQPAPAGAAPVPAPGTVPASAVTATTPQAVFQAAYAGAPVHMPGTPGQVPAQAYPQQAQQPVIYYHNGIPMVAANPQAVPFQQPQQTTPLQTYEQVPPQQQQQQPQGFPQAQPYGQAYSQQPTQVPGPAQAGNATAVQSIAATSAAPAAIDSRYDQQNQPAQRPYSPIPASPPAKTVQFPPYVPSARIPSPPLPTPSPKTVPVASMPAAPPSASPGSTFSGSVAGIAAAAAGSHYDPRPRYASKPEVVANPPVDPRSSYSQSSGPSPPPSQQTYEQQYQQQQQQRQYQQPYEPSTKTPAAVAREEESIDSGRGERASSNAGRSRGNSATPMRPREESVPGTSKPGRVDSVDSIGSDQEPADALLDAAWDGDLDGVARWLRRAPVSSCDLRGLTPLHLAAERDHLAVCIMLLDRGAKVDARANGGRMALHLASRFASADTVEMLLERAKASVNAETSEGRTALHYAASAAKDSDDERREVLRVLRDFGADPLIKDRRGETARDVAQAKGYWDAASTLRRAERRWEEEHKQNWLQRHNFMKR